MKRQDIQHVVKDSIKDNHGLLTALGDEKPVKLVRHQEEDIISSLLDLLPKSPEGKLALIGMVGISALIVLDLLHSKK